MERAIVTSLGRSGSVFAPTSGQLDLVTVKRAQGAPYTLQMAATTRRQVIGKAGKFRVQPLPIGPARDHAPITGLVFAGPKRKNRHGLLQSAALELRAGVALERQFNLLRTTEMFLRVVAAGPYAFSVTGTDAKVVVLPYGKPKQGKWPESAPDANGILATGVN